MAEISAAPSLGPVYLDASAWVKLYCHEPHSDALNAALIGRRDVVVSDLGLTEVVSALSRRAHEAGIINDAAPRAQREMLNHLERGFYRKVELTPMIHRDAERYLVMLSTMPVRAADALHLALAAAASAKTLACFDNRLRQAALEVGLLVFP